MPRRLLLPPVAFLAAVSIASTASIGCRATPSPTAERFARPPAGAVSGDARVTALMAGSFEERSRSSETLLAQGEAALAPLGEARDRVPDGDALVSARLDAVIAEVLHGTKDDRLVTTHLVAPSASVRRAAADETARRSLFGAVPALAGRLEDGDERVRSAAVSALRRLTNRLYDVSPRPCPAEAAEAAARTREWWAREGSTRTGPRADGG